MNTWRRPPIDVNTPIWREFISRLKIELERHPHHLDRETEQTYTVGLDSKQYPFAEISTHMRHTAYLLAGGKLPRLGKGKSRAQKFKWLQKAMTIPDVIRAAVILRDAMWTTDLEVLHNLQFPETDKLILVAGYCGLGDATALTGLVRDLYASYPEVAVDIRSPYPELFRHLKTTNLTDARLVSLDRRLALIENKQNPDCHWRQMFDDALYLKTGLKLKQRSLSPCLPHVPTGPKITGKYWILNAGYHDAAPAKHYPHYQKVVDLLKGQVQFVQIGHKKDHHEPIRGAINLVGKTSINDLLYLAEHCTGALSGPTGIMHIVAAYQKRGAVIVGNIEMPGLLRYPGYRVFSAPRCSSDVDTPCMRMFCRKHTCMGSIEPEKVAKYILEATYGQTKN
jgi:ADP-heptose:LPS heptosyltransferase